MLKGLCEYGKSHPEVVMPAGYAIRTVKFLTDLSSGGKFVMLRGASDDKKGLQVRCPDVGGAAQGGKANVLIEKAAVALGLDAQDGGKTGQGAKLEGKRESFLEQFREGLHAVPEFEAVLTALQDESTMDRIRAAATDAGVKPGDPVGFTVGGKCLWDLSSVQSWWAVVSQVHGTPSALDLVTGEPCVPARLFKKVPVSAAGGGQPSGSLLVSFDKDSFASYGLCGKQGANAPMSQATADMAMDAFIYLAGKGLRIGDGMKLVHWFDHDIALGGGSDEEDIFQAAFGPSAGSSDEDPDPDVRNAQADDLVRSPFSGNVPADLEDVVYHVMVIKAEMARCTVRRYGTGTYGELYRNLKLWFDDMALVRSDGRGMCAPRKFNGLLYALLSGQERGRAGLAKFSGLTSLSGQMLDACFHGRPLPDAALHRALACVESSVHANGIVPEGSVQVVKMWFNRNLRKNGKGGLVMPDNNDGTRSAGWYCGELLALYDRIQKETRVDRNSDVIERFYVGCCRAPRATLNRLQQLSIAHFRDIRNPFRKGRLKAALEETYGKLCDTCGSIPATLSPGEQAAFLLGYYFRVAHMGELFEDTAVAGGDIDKEVNGNVD